MRLLAAILLLPLARPVQEDDRLDLEVLPEEFERKWAAAEEIRDWKLLVELYEGACDKFAACLAPPERAVTRWVRLPWPLARRLTGMSDGALDRYETAAQQRLEGVVDERRRRQIIERYAYTRTAHAALEALANREFDEGQIGDAVRDWSRALEIRTSADLVARLAHAHATAGDRVSLSALLARAVKEEWKGQVTAGGQRRELRDFLAALRPAPESAPLRKPARSPAPTNEIPLGQYEFKSDGNTFGRGLGTAWPACGRRDGRDVVVVTNGLKAVALDPGRARGGTLEDAVDWRYPKEGTARYYMPTPYGGPHPLLGATLDGGRAFVTMFGRQRQHQSGRRPDRYEGPAVLRALSLATGDSLWSTEDLLPTETDVEPELLKKIQGVDPELYKKLRDLKYNYWFPGPPLVRNNRVFAIVMTLLPERQCYVLSLEPAEGKPVWFTKVASAPPTRNITSVPTMVEEDGQIVVSTGFGVAASVHTVTGAVEWVLKYATSGARYSVSPPVLHRSVAYVLAQDAEELLALDRWTGRELALPDFSEEVSWSRISYLAGRAGDWLALTGSKNYVVRALDGRVVELVDSDGPRVGRASVGEGVFYLPTRSALHVYDTITWRVRDTVSWTFGDESPNVLAADSLLLVLGDRLELSTSRASLRARFGEPTRPEACRQLGQILEASGRAVEAVSHYRKALRTWEKDPAWEESAEGLRKKLTELADKLGDEFPKE